MTRIKIEDFIPFAEQLAMVSGEIVRRYFRKSVHIEEKNDLSPVTEADKEIEHTIRALIRSTYPEHGIIGEEFDEFRPDAEFTWMIDPIDGTKSFIIGRPLFGTLISLLHKDVPVLGIIDQPVLGERWTGVKGFATNFNYVPTKTRACLSLKDAILCTTSPHLFEGKDFEIFDRIRKQVKYVVYGGDCYSYGLLANGSVDLVIETGLKPYDFCALSPVVNGARGKFTDWQGKEVTRFSDGRVIASGDPRLHAELLKHLV